MDTTSEQQISLDETSGDPVIPSYDLPLLKNDSKLKSEEDVFEDSFSYCSCKSSVKGSTSIADHKSMLNASTQSLNSLNNYAINAVKVKDPHPMNLNGCQNKVTGNEDISHVTPNNNYDDDKCLETEDHMTRSFPKIRPAFQEKRHRQPCSITCCYRSCQWPKPLTWSRCCEQNDPKDDDIHCEDEPFRKKNCHGFFTVVYVCFAAFAVFVTYAMIQDLITSMNNPVRSNHYAKVNEYTAPGIAVIAGGARFLACGHSFNNVVISKVSLTQLDLTKHTCNFTDLYYTDPHYPVLERHVTIMRGPTSFVRREAIFLHFELEDELRDFFTVDYFVFPDYDRFVKLNITEQRTKITDYHRTTPTFALSAGFRMWIKLIMSESHLTDGTKHTDFKVEYSVVRFHDRREEEERNRNLFFIFFEWKSDVIEQSYLIYTTTPWSIAAGLCAIFLTLQNGFQFCQTSYQRLQKEKAKRSSGKKPNKRNEEKETIFTSR